MKVGNKGMQNVANGLIVRTILGHDKNEVFAIIAVKDKFAYLANGKDRPCDNPKKKNVKHFIKIGYSEEILDLIDNSKLNNSHIIRILKEYR